MSARKGATRSDYNATDASATRRELTLPPQKAGLRLDQVMTELLREHSRSRIQQWIKSGRILVDGELAEPKRKVWGGEAVQVESPVLGPASGFSPEAIALEIVYEDEALLVVNKPPGLVVHPGSGNWRGTMLNALLHHEPQLRDIPRAGIVHRLDKETSGLLVVAKTFEAQTDLIRQLQARSVTREYLAIVHGLVPGDGKVEAPIGRHPRDRIRMAVVSSGKPAVTYFRVIERFTHYTVLVCCLETGRTHQIRVHMQSIGFPLLGDPVYGPKGVRSAAAEADRIGAFRRQALHAAKLKLVHPVSGKRMTWKVAPPADFNRLILALRASAP